MEGDVKGVATQTKPAPADLFCIHMSAVIIPTHYRNIHQINQYLCPSFASCIRRRPDDRMTGWQDNWMTWLHDDQMIGWHDDRKLRRRLTVWYIFICISITQSTDEPRLLACILQQIYSSFQGWFLSISTFGTGNTKVWFFSMEILLRTWNETFPLVHAMAQIPGDPNLEIFEHESCWARLHLICCWSEMLEWLWWAADGWTMSGYYSKKKLNTLSSPGRSPPRSAWWGDRWPPWRPGPPPPWTWPSPWPRSGSSPVKVNIQ